MFSPVSRKVWGTDLVMLSLQIEHQDCGKDFVFFSFLFSFFSMVFSRVVLGNEF